MNASHRMSEIQSLQPKFPFSKPKPAMALLVAIHVVIGLVLAWITEDDFPSFPLFGFVGLVFSQTSLLGFWGGLGTNHWLIRLSGVVLGIGYLAPMFAIGVGVNNIEIYLLVAVSTVMVAAVLLAIRWLPAELRRADEASVVASQEGLQFSIRHLMLLTFAVAVTLGVGRWLQPYFSAVVSLTLLAVYALCFVSIGLSAVWAMLGRSRVVLRSMMVLLIAVAASCALPFMLRSQMGMDWFLLTMMLADAICLLASLYVVRLCGYRLVRLVRLRTN